MTIADVFRRTVITSDVEKPAKDFAAATAHYYVERLGCTWQPDPVTDTQPEAFHYLPVFVRDGGSLWHHRVDLLRAHCRLSIDNVGDYVAATH
jgi:hypothetical protein